MPQNKSFAAFPIFVKTFTPSSKGYFPGTAPIPEARKYCFCRDTYMHRYIGHPHPWSLNGFPSIDIQPAFT
jgi:hypothetical protein